jgi:hypothetical protein
MNALRPRDKLIPLFVLAALFGLTAGVALATADEPRPAIGVYPSDTDGDGVISDSGDERFPELIQAAGDNGVLGYVRLEDLEGPQPATPEEAVAMSGETRVIPVYAEDGETVVDTFTISEDATLTPTPTPTAEATP